MYKIFRVVLLMGVAATLTTTGMQGQATPSNASQQELDLALTYATQYSNLVNGNTFWMHGGTAELSAELYHGWGLAANVAGTQIGDLNTASKDLTVITSTFGPHYTRQIRGGKIALFGEALIGESHGLDNEFPTSEGVKNDFNTFAFLIGGGVDLRISRHFAVRPFQAEWLRTQFPNSTTNVQNNLRLEAGIVFRISH